MSRNCVVLGCESKRRDRKGEIEYIEAGKKLSFHKLGFLKMVTSYHIKDHLKSHADGKGKVGFEKRG
jgi:hypothetical protein